MRFAHLLESTLPSPGSWRRWFTVFIAALVVAGLQTVPHSPVAHAALTDGSVILNETGGLTAGDGLIIKVGAGWRSIGRNSAQQVYVGRGTDWTDDPDDQAAWIAETTSQAVRPYNGIILQVDNTSICFDARPEEEGKCFLSTYLGELDEGMTPVSWDSATTTLVDPTAPTYQAVTVLEKEIPARGNPDDLLEYVLTVTTDYTSPNSYATVTYSLAVPAGADHEAINLYDGIDMYLDGEDYGPATTFVEGGRRTIVQYNDTAMGGFREVPAAATDSSERFGSYTAADYPCLFGAETFGPDDQCPPDGGHYGPYDGSPYPDVLTTDPEFTDIGVAIAWALGDASTLAGGTVTRQSELFFTAPFILSSAFSAASVAPGSTVDVVYTFNASIPGSSYSDIGFDVNLPPGATVAGAVTNTCGGDAEESGGLVSVSAGTLAAPAQTCTVSVPVSFSSTGTVSLEDSQFVSGSASGLSIIPALSGSVTVATPQPDPGPNPGPAPNPTPTPSSAPTSAQTPPPTQPESDPLGPVLGSDNSTIPPGGLQAGSSVLLSNGEPLPVTVTANSTRKPVALIISAQSLTPPLNMRLEGRGDDSDPLGLTSKQALILESEPVQPRSAGLVLARKQAKKVQPLAQSSGDGFMANSPVKFHILPSTYLGDLITDDAGAYTGRLPIPPGIRPGVYTLQANGFAPDGSVRSLSIGVLVKATSASVKAAKARSSVYFAPLSAHVSPASKKALRRLVGKTGKNVTQVVSIGYVQPTNSTSNDKTLSTQRAKNVAAYLKELGVKGKYVVRGDGKAAETGATARRVIVTITYVKR